MTAPHDLDPPFEVAAYVDQMTRLLELSVPEAIRPQVAENFAQMQAIAQPVLEFELPDTIEPAPVFEP